MVECGSRVDSLVAEEEGWGSVTLPGALQVIIRGRLHPESCKIDASARVEVEVTVAALRSHCLQLLWARI